MPRKNLAAGILQDFECWEINLAFIPHAVCEPVFITSNTGAWIVDISLDEISNGRWLLGVNDKYDIYDVALLPGKKVDVTSKGTSFICNSEDVNVAGKVILTMGFDF
ncbi:MULTISPECIES: hypothetical protein [unclassified Pantoea]|uniref:hypothetical protein n=1 Tax=unclassified Pantoea TaxID=2630326 RepID=UPI00351D7D5A